jgi:hypothetical protein
MGCKSPMTFLVLPAKVIGLYVNYIRLDLPQQSGAVENKKKRILKMYPLKKEQH